MNAPRRAASDRGFDVDLNLTARRALITGGSKGIGLAIAHSFAAEGANVVIVSRNQAALENAAGEVRRKHNARLPPTRPTCRTATRVYGCISRFPTSTFW